jgi:hemerythrin-like domain-containing protein
VQGDRSDETDPFARLERTHQRIEERLVTLEQAVVAVADSARRMEALEDIYEVVDFFGRAAKRHHDDEEQSLFPRLRAAGALLPLLAALAEEHRQHDAALAELVAVVDAWGDDGPDLATEARLPALARHLAEVYRAHIAREERELFPAARAALPAQVIEDIGKEMLERRPGRRQ